MHLIFGYDDKSASKPLRRTFGGATLLLLIAVTVSACGATDSEPSGNGTVTPSGPASAEEIAVYAGADREDVLRSGAKNEGSVNLYTNPTGDITKAVVAAFEAEYPDIKVNVTQGGPSDLSQRVAQEFSARQPRADVIETSAGTLGELKTAELLVKFTSPEASAYKEGSVTDYLATVRQSYIGLGYNTDLLSEAEVPKSIDDLLDAKWKGKMAIPTSTTGVGWVAALELTKGKEFIEKLAAQEIQGQNVSGRALADFVVSGEVELSPTIYNSHVALSSGKGAPIAWQALEPVIASPTAVALANGSPHPNAAMLYIDFVLSKAGQDIYSEYNYDSARTDIPSDFEFETIYVETRDDYAERYPDWENDMQMLIRK